jgi:RNA polymerase sigma-70 factor (ECF subfamily)
VTRSDPEHEARIDAALIARAAQLNDRVAFGQLILRHQGLVRAQLRRLTCGDHAWADDIAQETFLTAWRKLDQFRGESRFTTWLFRVSYATFLQAARQRRSRPRLQSGAEQDEQAPRDESEFHALRLDLTTALMQLPEAERAALVHCYHLDLSHEEAAEVLGIPVGTVKTHVARGKIKLRELLSAWNAGRVRKETQAPTRLCGGDKHG